MKDTEIDDLEEGHLYTVKNGVVQEIVTDPEDTMRKLRVTDDAIESITLVQRKMRKSLGGYKPDISMVASALIKKGSEDPQAAVEAVRQYVLSTFKVTTDDAAETVHSVRVQ